MRLPRIYFARPPRQALLAFGLLVVIWTLALSIRSMGISPTARAAHTVNQWMRPPPRKQNHDLPHLPAGAVVPCVGPRGKNLDGNSQDEAEFIDASVAPFKSPYPEPFIGSYDAMKAPKTYTTVDRRYGPFGHLENEPGYNFTKVDWNTIDWGRLQNQCLSRNSQRFGVGAAPLDFASNAGRRFALQSRTMMPKIKSWDQFNETGRTAIVIRTWGTYNWLPADLQHVRSLITETALWSGGKYAVILLVHLQDKDAGIFTSDEAYDKAFKNTTIPQELRSIALLWDDNLLESWYPKIPEHQTMYQVFQPMQLLALHYPEFDHYWQFEMDQRFTGHAGKYLEASTEFARKEPRKQIWERASFPYLPKAYSSYEDFFKRVDDANHGGTHYWGAVGIPDIQAIGPQPPTQHATQDDFKWGVGEDADCLVASVCANVLTSNTWVFKDWLMNAKEDKRNVPRWFCPPAIQRGSRTLLLEIHRAQHTLGLAVPSEATLPTYALWLGLKISYPPMPVYHQDQGTEAEAALFEKWNHGGASASEDGFGLADPQDYFDWKTTFWWTSNFAKQTIDAFYGAPWNDQPYPHQLVKHEGKVYAPNMMMHPVKQ